MLQYFLCASAQPSFTNTSAETPPLVLQGPTIHNVYGTQIIHGASQLMVGMQQPRLIRISNQLVCRYVTPYCFLLPTGQVMQFSQVDKEPGNPLNVTRNILGHFEFNLYKHQTWNDLEQAEGY